MKIEQSGVALNATHDYVYESEIEASRSFRMVLSDVSQAEAVARNDSGNGRLLLLLHRLITQMLDAISGRQTVQTTDLVDIGNRGRTTPVVTVGEQSGRRLLMEWSTEVTETLREYEATSFAANGTVRTADGRTIDFSMELDMCRDYSCQRTVRQSGSVELRDPLVINFDGKAAELSGTRFEFDLDADGTVERIPGLVAGSAWLAFDRNADGCINDGSELFGARSGNGFADLACLDDDGNRWLDEADTAFGQLRLWEQDETGAGTLSTLGEKGVGAIYLGSVQTPFALTDAENEKRGYIRASGVYLREDGGVGSVQQVDLAV